ncbi:MAG: histidine phosphatase family protein [Blautia sp.]|nr:histidine phosphatase family protein [Blautia sp.]
MLIYIIRHGITAWNRLKKTQGTINIPLEQEGIDLAVATGRVLSDLHIDVCYTSPLLRAKQTALGMLKGQSDHGEVLTPAFTEQADHWIARDGRVIPVIEEPRIREINFGTLEGSVYMDENRNVLSKEMDVFFKNPRQFARPEKGENIADIEERTAEFWKELIQDPALQNRTVLVSSHGCAVRALLQNVYEEKESFWHGCVPPNCSISIVEVKDGKAKLLEHDKIFY